MPMKSRTRKKQKLPMRARLRQAFTKKNAKKTAAAIARLLLSIFLIGIITVFVVVGAMSFYVIKTENPGAVEIGRAKLDYTSILYATDSSGNTAEIDRVYKDGNRIWVDLDKIPKNLQDAVVAAEDQRFKEHDGVDWKRTVSAFANEFLHFYGNRQGGSTITQQLIKNITNNKEAKFSRKIQEILSALATEQQYTKDQILEAYLNTVPFGGQIYGVQVAANAYFSKDVSQLDLAECATLATMIQSPSSLEPIKHMKANTTRRNNYVLPMMKKLNLSKKKQADLDAEIAAAEKEDVKVAENKSVMSGNHVRSWFVDQALEDVENDLVEKYGYTQSHAQDLVFNEGLKIYTTMDPYVQKSMEEVYANDSYFPTAKDPKPNSAMIIVDYQGQIKGIVGARGTKSGNKLLNYATDEKRQPGSSIKPLAVYGPAIDYNLVTWSTILSDTPVMKVDGKDYPKNQSGSYSGNMPLTEGLARSLNTIAIRTIQMVTPAKSFDFLTRKLSFTSLVSSRMVNGKVYTYMGYWRGAGAITDGVTLREMAGGYEIFGNGGLFYKPYTYTKVEDNDGNILLQNNPSPVRAISADSAYVMNQLLQQVVQASYGTGTPAKFSNGMQVGAKTGTTSDNKDRWFVGITPYYVGVNWYGYAPTPKDLGNGANPSLKAWKAVMDKVHANLSPSKTFDIPSGVVQLPYDRSTGLVTPDITTNPLGWYKASNIPSAGTAAAAITSSPSPAP